MVIWRFLMLLLAMTHWPSWGALLSEDRERENTLFYVSLPKAFEVGFVKDVRPIFSFDHRLASPDNKSCIHPVDSFMYKRFQDLKSAAHLWRKLVYGWDTITVFSLEERRYPFLFMNEKMPPLMELMVASELFVFDAFDEESKRATLLAMHDEFIKMNLRHGEGSGKYYFSEIFRRHVMQWDALMRGMSVPDY